MQLNHAYKNTVTSQTMSHEPHVTGVLLTTFAKQKISALSTQYLQYEGPTMQPRAQFHDTTFKIGTQTNQAPKTILNVNTVQTS